MLSISALWAHDVEIDGIYYNLDETNNTAEVTYEGDVYTYYNEYNGSVSIPESITCNSKVYTVTSVGYAAFQGCSDLTSVTIPKNVTTISKHAFIDCSGLTSVTIGCDSITFLSNSAFKDCSSLTSVVWNVKYCGDFLYSSFYNSYPPFYFTKSKITSFTFGDDVERIPAYLCYDMDSLISVEIGSSVTSIGSSAFEGCSGLTSVTIPNSVTSIGGSAFSGCSGLTSVTIGNSVTSIGGSAFSGCSGLTSITIPTSITSIGSYAFSGCSGLTSVVWNIKNYSGFSDYDDSPFYNIRSKITSFTLENEVERIPNYLCYGMSSLEEITIPNSVTSIGSSAFYKCSNLKKVRNFSELDIVKGNTTHGYVAYYADVVGNKIEGDFVYDNNDVITEYIGDVNITSIEIPLKAKGIDKTVFTECTKLTSVVWNAKNCADFSGYSSSPFYNIRSKITSFTFGNEVECIPAYLFYEMNSLKEITIPNSVTSIGEDAFSYCSGLTKVNYLGSVEKWVEFDFTSSTSNPTYYAQDLYINGELLTEVKIYSADSIKFSAFYNCKSIKSVEIGSNITSIGSSAFYGCNGMTSIVWNAKNCTDFSGYSSSPFYGVRSQITSFTYGNEVEHIPAYLCYEMSSLKEITIPTSVISIGEDAFEGCSGLTSVVWNAKNCIDFSSKSASPFYNIRSNISSFTFGNEVEHIPAYLCYVMENLKEIIILTSVTSIGDYAFEGCSGLTSVTIPGSVTSIGSSAFDGCSGLTSVVWNAKNCTDFSSNSASPFYNIRSNITSFTFGNEVEHIPAYLCYGMSGINEISVPKSVKSIGDDAFYYCNNLSKVNYNASVNDWVKIDFYSNTSNPINYSENLYINGELLTEVKITSADSIKPYAFYYCKGIKYVELGSSVKYIGNSAFNYCNNLKTVYNRTDLDIIKGKTTHGYVAYYADVVGKEENGFIYNAQNTLIDYIGDTTLVTLDLPNVIEGVISGIFNRFTNLKSIRIGDNVKNISNEAFDGCDNLMEINVSNENNYFSSEEGVLFDKDKTTLIKYPKAKESTSITIPNSVTNIKVNAFSDCNKLNSIVWEAQNCNNFENFEENPFYNIRENITSVVFGDSVEHIPAYLCYEMNKLSEVSIPASLQTIGTDAFYNCLGITSIKWNAIECENYTVSTAPFNSISSNITSFIFGNEVKHIPAYLCYNINKLADVTITNNVTTIGINAFEGCTNLNTIVWNAIKAKNFEESTSPFNPICTKITSFIFGEEVEHIPSYICNGMAKVSPKVIPNSVKTIGKYAFWGTRVYKTNWEEGVLYIDSCLIKAENEELKDTYSIKEGTRLIADEAFLDCNVLTSLSLASTISYVGNDAFSGCTNLTEIVIPNNIVYMGWNVFSECYRLSSIIWNVKKCDDFENYETSPFYDIRERITSFKFGNEVEYIPAFLCYDMSNIPQISLPSSVKVIGKYAFAYCDDLTSLVISDGVITINDCAFSGCRYVNELLIGKSVEHIGTNVFQNCYNIDNIVWNAKNCSDFESAMQSAFYSIRSNISSFKIGNGVEYIPAYLCYGMDDLYSIIVPENVTAIGQEAFSNCNYLNSVIWKAKNCKDFSSQTVSPFYNQTNRHVSYFTFGNKVEHIPSYLCYGMGNLTEVLIPHRVVSLGDSVFFNCENLTKVTSYPRNVPTTGEDVFAHYNAYLYVQCVSLDEYVGDDVFGMFKRIKCIEVDEVEIEAEEDSEKIEIEIDEENNNATITWPSTNNAKSYELVISRKGEVFCTLIFNSNGQLLSIDFSTRSASIGFQFIVTGLEEASKYDYKLLALDENNNELQSYYGEFETSGYVEEEDEDTEETAIIENLADANITISEGVISCPDSDFTIYNTIGQNVTSQNGSLTPGVYVVQVDNDFVKVMMK